MSYKYYRNSVSHTYSFGTSSMSTTRFYVGSKVKFGQDAHEWAIREILPSSGQSGVIRLVRNATAEELNHKSFIFGSDKYVHYAISLAKLIKRGVMKIDGGIDPNWQFRMLKRGML